MRLPYVTNPPDFSAEGDKAIVERIKQRRGARGLISLDLALLHSPPVADGWNTFLRAIRTQTTISTSVRETAICRVAVLNRAWYEWEHHAPLLPPETISPAGLKYIFASDPFIHDARTSDASGLDEQHLAVLAYSDYSTLEIEVPEEVLARLKKQFTERELVEITATIGCYNCVSRVLVALNVGERNGTEGMATALENTGRQALQGTEPAPRSKNQMRMD